MEGVIRVISPGLVLRSHLESFKDLSLDHLKKILRSHYGVKNTAELYQSSSICQNGRETPQAFLMRFLDMRQKILFASQDGEDPLKYDAGHFQQLFCRTVETGLQDDSIRTKLRPFLRNLLVEDKELIHQLNVAILAEEERIKKLKNQWKGKSPIVSQINQESPEPPIEDPKSTDSTESDFQELNAAVEALKTEVKARSGTSSQSKEGRGNRWTGGRGQGRHEVRPCSSRCSKFLAKGEQWCNHCFKCGNDSQYAIGCRCGELAGQQLLS